MRVVKYLVGIVLLAGLFSCGKKAEITGVVFDNFGKAVEGATIKIENTAFTATTDKRGRYHIAYVPGKVDVNISKQGYSEEKLSLNIAIESKFPAKDVTLYKTPSGNGVFACGPNDYIPLEQGKLSVRQAGWMGADSSYYVSGDSFSILKGSRTVLMENDGKAHAILEVGSNGLIVSPRSNTAPINVPVTQVGLGIFLWDITSLKNGRFALVTTAVTIGGLVPIAPVCLFEVTTKDGQAQKLADDYYQKGEVDKAITSISEAIKINPKTGYLVSRAMMHKSKGDYDSAVSDYTQAITIDPKYWPSYGGRGSCYLLKGEYKKAFGDFNVMVNAGYWTYLLDIGEMYFMSGDLNYVLRFADMVIRKDPDGVHGVEGYLLKIKFFKENKDITALNKTVTEVEKCLKRIHSGYVLDTYYIEIYIEAGVKPQKALELAEKRIKGSSNSYNYYLLGRAQLSNGKTKEAIESLKKALELGPQFMTTYCYWLGRIYREELKDKKTASEYYTKVLKINPKFRFVPKDL